MIVIMVVTFYTTRVVLKELGVTDFAVYNLVGSVAISLVFIQNALSNATQRYLSFELGTKKSTNVCKVFSMSVNLHVLLAMVTVILLETFGLWFLNRVLNVPHDKVVAANVAYQFSIFTYVVTLLRIPHNALIVSNEKMNLFAIISIIEALLRLGVAFMISNTKFPKLEFYTFMLFVSAIIVNFFFWLACKLSFREQCSFHFEKNKSLFKSMIGFLGWNMFGGVVSIAVQEGPGYIMNIYLGVAINATIGIAKQVSSGVYNLSSNFQNAFNPQIVKSYADNDHKGLFKLIVNTSIMSYYLLFVIAVPFIICGNGVLKLWLTEVPDYTMSFCVFIITSQMLSAISAPLWMTAHAIGNIRNYQIILSIINIMILPISSIIMILKLEPYYVYVALVGLNSIILLYRILYLRNKITFGARKYIGVLVKSCLLPSSLCVLPLLVLKNFLGDSLLDIAIISISSIFVTSFVFIYIVIDKNQRNRFFSLMRYRL